MATKTSKASPRGTKAVAKKKGILSKVNFYSRKTQFIIVVLIIAIAGGGYFTYKSFAATVVSSDSAARMADLSNPKIPTVVEQLSSTGKANTRVARLSPGQSIKFYFESATSHGNACITARYENPGGAKPSILSFTASPNVTGPGATTQQSTRYVSLHNSYEKVCSGTIGGWSTAGGNVVIRNNGPSTVRMNLFTFERPDAPAPAPAPAPAK